MEIVFKDFCTFTGVYFAIYMIHVQGSSPYLTENFKLPNCWASEVPHLSCPISDCPAFQTVDIYFSLAREPTCPPYLVNLFFDIFKSFPVLLWLNFEYWITCQLCWFRCKSATVYVFPGVFSSWSKKKERHRQKSQQKNNPQNSVKNIRPYSLSRENENFATTITHSKKSNSSYKLMSLGNFSLGASSGRQLFRFDPWFSFLLWWYLSLKFWLKLLVSRRSILRKFHMV